MNQENPKKEAEAKKSAVGMQDFNCDMLAMSLRFSLEEFDQDRFVEAVGIENKEDFIDEDGDFTSRLTMGAREDATDYHAHIRVLLLKEGKSRIEISYHAARHEIEGETPPYAEDCVQWLAGFFKIDKVEATVQSSYTFNKSYSPVIALPFPFTTSEKKLAGALVSGLSIILPPKDDISAMAIIQDTGNGSILSIATSRDVVLKDFDLPGELERFSDSVSSLIKKQEAGNDNRTDKE